MVGRTPWRRADGIGIVATLVLPILILIGALRGADAADVNITTSTNDGINLDPSAGTTAEIASGVTVNNSNGTANCPSSTSLCASTKSWTLTNRGTIGPNPVGNGVRFTAGGTVINAGTVDNANISITGGAGSVTNQAGASITSTANGITFATSGAQFGGALVNNGSITGTGSGDLVALFGGGTVTNNGTGSISASNNSNAVSISGGTVRTVVNSGTIQNTGPSFATGIFIQGAGATNTVTNNAGGRIIGGFNGIFTGANAVLALDNAGEISSTRGSAVEATQGGTLTNSGTIASANANGILTRNTAAAEVINSGTITGAVNTINFTNAGGGAVGAAHTVRLRTGSILNGNVLGGTGTDNLILEGTGAESIAKFSNFETLSMQGSAWTLSGAGSFGTSATLQSGTLSVGGTLTSPTVTVQNGATLGGTGTIVGALTNNGDLAPGNSIGTLNLTGAYTQATGSSLTVEVDSTGASDLLDVTGAATIQAGAAVNVRAAAGTYTVGTRSTILTASGGVTGTYDSLTDNAAFLDFALAYDANNVFLDVNQIAAGFATVTETPNQSATAGAVEALGAGNLVFDAVLPLSTADAQDAFDQLSGEIYASTRTVLLDQGAILRDALNDRLLQADGAEDAQLASLQPGFGLIDGDTSCTPAFCVFDRQRPWAAWVRAIGSWNHTDGDGNAGTVSGDTAGFLSGVDVTLAQRWRLGLAGGYSHSSIDVPSRGSTAAIDSYHLAAYGGFRQGTFSARAVASYSFHDIDTARDIDFTGFSDDVQGSGAARTAQVAGEIANDFRFGNVLVAPMAGLAYLNLDSDGLREHVGAAALRIQGDDDDVLYSTLGFRAGTSVRLFDAPLRLHGMVGWRHAFGDTTPETRLQFDGGGAAFEVSPVPIARDSALVEAGAAYEASDRLTLGLTYSGQFAPDAWNNAVRGDLTFRF